MYNADEAIFLLKDSENLEKIPMKQYDSEELLQSLIEKHPELLAGDQINPDEPVRWMLVRREAGVPDGDQHSDRWAIDHLLLDQNAIPTFVETKRSTDTRIRREIVGQMLDYAANAQRYWPADHIRSMAATQYSGPDAADAALMKLLGLESADNTVNDINDYWAKVQDNLQNGRVRLIFIADRLPTELRRIIEFLNDQMEKAEVLGIELAQYVGSNLKALVPRVVGQTEAIRQKKQNIPSKRRVTMQEFLDNCPEDSRDFFAKTIVKAKEHGMQIYWGVKGFSLRTHDNMGKMITLLYGFPPGSPGKDSAIIQGYVGYIDDIEYRNQLRQRFLAIPGTTQQGEFTIGLELNRNTLANANNLLQVVWDTNTELSQMNSSANAQE
ncbi:hypothetical protein ACFLUX_02555 [Chloroflexota bacterium]